MLDSACKSDDLPAFGGPTNAICATPSRVAMQRLLAHTRLLDLRVDPLAQVGVGAVPVVGQLREGRAQLLDALAALLADEATLDHLLGDTMRDRHQADLPSFVRREGARAAALGELRVPVPPLPRTHGVEAAD
jgi:hypothetical protein